METAATWRSVLMPGMTAGFLQTSDDGVNWTSRDGHNATYIRDLYDVTFRNGTFVAVGWDWFGGGNIYHSTNGINWTSHNTAIGNNLACDFKRDLVCGSWRWVIAAVFELHEPQYLHFTRWHQHGRRGIPDPRPMMSRI